MTPTLEEAGWLRRSISGMLVLLVALGLGRFAFPPLIPALVSAGRLSVAQAGYAAATGLGGYALGAALGEPLARRWGTARAARVALVAAIVSLWAGLPLLGAVSLFASRFCAGLAGGVLMVLTPTLALTAAPRARLGTATGIVFTGMGAGIALGGVVIPRLARFCVDGAWLGVAGAGLLCAGFAFPGLAEVGPASPSPRDAWNASRAEREQTWLELAYVLVGVGFAPTSVFLVDFASRGLGLGLAFGGWLWGLFGAGAALGPLLLAPVGARIGWGRTFLLALVAGAFGVALPVLASGKVALAASALVGGTTGLGITAVASACAGELAGARGRKRLWGRMTLGFSVSYAVTTYVLAFLLARTGSYRLLFATGAAALLGAALCTERSLRCTAIRAAALSMVKGDAR